MSISKDFLIQANREQGAANVDGFTETRYEQFSSWLQLGTSRVLDVGAGTGRGGAVLKRNFPEIFLSGLDCVPERVELIPEGIYDEKICAFADQVPVENRSIDAIVAGEFLEHVPSDKVDATLCEFFRILKLKGTLLLTTPNPGYIKNRFKGLSVMLDPCHVSQHFPSALKHRLQYIGYSHIHVRGSGQVSKMLGTKLPLPLYGSYLVRAVKW